MGELNKQLPSPIKDLMLTATLTMYVRVDGVCACTCVCVCVSISPLSNLYKFSSSSLESFKVLLALPTWFILMSSLVG